MKVALMTVTIDKHTNREIDKQVREVKAVNADDFLQPLAKVLGDAFLEYFKKGV